MTWDHFCWKGNWWPNPAQATADRGADRYQVSCPQTLRKTIYHALGVPAKGLQHVRYLSSPRRQGWYMILGAREPFLSLQNGGFGYTSNTDMDAGVNMGI